MSCIPCPLLGDCGESKLDVRKCGRGFCSRSTGSFWNLQALLTTAKTACVKPGTLRKWNCWAAKRAECQAVGLAGWSELALVVGELILTTAVALVGSGGTGWIARGPAYQRAPPKGADALLPSALQTIICWSKLELRQVLRVHLDRCQVCLSPWTARQESNEVWMTRLLRYSEILGH